MNIHSLFLRSMLWVALLPLTACNGILSDIYDEPEEKSDYGFVEISDGRTAGKIYINSTSYTRWTYIDFANQKIDSVEITDNMVEPSDWGLAIHRYDAKTNGGAVMATDYSSLEALLASGSMPAGEFTPDEPSKVAIDMSGMMDGNIIYSASDVNPVLSQWLNVDTSTMPPVYTLSGKVYIVKLSDGTCAAVRLFNFMNDASVKGYMTVEYLYPLTF